ncbi:type II toxin-antitoxin system VapC family toxin [Aetokthonos hydrillicola Thurmond2011]|jgi:PIN domain nuclease of toxin-antitoxin system|uniref:Type II toxin-antitoxin system VapC family toxin n=1 Tax=Aetokthonos hydrillicola Thurmond2011 TaxID=2712845 RepID=A0AAP5I7Z2_9CYAN|nr:type II toxin-antitoxin system VapC family toxin [Aetokthonos hydrillicola]MBO3458203.1 type II toxin-antitoxin system VapC family toxin [Aetokthonos hydrillicola CCALA 1050]MBW4584423.1 type II toxin-antitoxin system VapC family toxin [Aetokthonos hydrillicola CCALA 1050]MDR9896384.1 type II toxin-antitoxin system VapC family toxin [Aetokthonos hydrillicola Thurmond2011]
MKILLDTHIFLWFISADNRLPTDVRNIIRDINNQVYLSVVSVWESIIKYQLGKLPLPESPETYLPKQRERHRITSLDLNEDSVAQLVKLPLLHRDPFDRMLICQALQHNLIIATVDAAIRNYSINILLL